MIQCLTCIEIFNQNLFKMENLFLCFQPMKCAGIAMLALSSLVLAMFFLVYAKKNEAGKWFIMTGRLIVLAMGAIIVCSVILCAMNCCDRDRCGGDGCKMGSSCHENKGEGCGKGHKGCGTKDGGGQCGDVIRDGDDIEIMLIDSTGSEGDSMPKN